MPIARDANSKLNLSKAVVLIIQNNQTEADILAQVFVGFGVQAIRKYLSVADAEDVARRVEFDLMIVDGDLPDDEGLEFIKRVRRDEANANRLAPILLVSGHTPSSAVLRARDCGANFVVAKPITPKVLLDRIMWLVQDEREFVESEGYMGPCRRRKMFGPPPGMAGRRKDDLPVKLGAPSGPDLMQSEIDALLSPKKAVA